MVKLTIAFIALITISGCSSKMPFYATGGSRGDGTVDMAYDTELFVDEIVNFNEAQKLAEDKCKVWGYQSAEIFGGQTENCYQRNGYGDCLKGQMIVKYQCIGDLGVGAQTPSQSSAPVSNSSSSGLMTKEQYMQHQLNELKNKNLPYDEYQKQYKAIIEQ